MTHSVEEITVAVAKGAELLDIHFLEIRPGGRNWYDIVDAETVDLNSWIHCVIGQIFGVKNWEDYNAALKSLAIQCGEGESSFKWVEEAYGFDPIFTPDDEYINDYSEEVLPHTHNSIWADAITARRNA